MRVLRWIAVLPAAAICAVLVAFPIHWLTLLVYHQNSFVHGFLTSEGMERFGYSLIVPAAFVVAGSKVAPGYRTRTSVVLSLLLVAAITLGAIAASQSPTIEFTDPIWLLLLKGLLSIASLVWAILFVRKQEYGA